MSVIILLERLGPHIEREVNLVINSEQEAESLSSKLRRIQVGLKEAERQGVTDDGVRGWLKDLEDVTYQMDNVLDEWEAVNLQVEVQDICLDWEQVRVRPLLCLYSCFNQLRSRREISLEMKALSEKIDTILIGRGQYSFVSSENDHAREFRQPESTSLVSNEFKPYGLDDVKKSLLEKLDLEGKGSGRDTQVISIVGVGGVGKTTLALVAYNDPDVDGLFAPKGWVCVSQLFDAKDIARAILVAFGEKSDGAQTLDTLVNSIKKAVSEKRFLLVLDNVWLDDRSKWEEIKKCFHGRKGSRIVVTTRLETVARIMDTDQQQSLGLLSDSDCGMILNGVALKGRPSEECEILRPIGMEIAEKCCGLPLAANCVGSMLALGSFTQEEWRDVVRSPLWTNGEGKSDVFRLLNLSYIGLSPLLKRCFFSSVFFPKGTEISSDEIIRLWMAYGYLNSKSSISEVQLKGSNILKNLVMRSFFLKFASEYIDQISFLMHERKSYKMHDIMHKFGRHVGSDEYSFIKNAGLEEDDRSPSPNSLLPSSLGKLRTFCVSQEELRPGIVSHLTSVRVLSMRECKLKGLPKDIGKLIHLRYLNVSDNPITELPETITDLCHLQTLDIQRCELLLSLPKEIRKLTNLRHLVNTDTFKLVEFPQGLEKLSDLWTLSEFRGSNLGCLRDLNQLQGSLLLCLNNLNEQEAGGANLSEKENIKNLKLVLDREKRFDVAALEPPPNLQTLEIKGKCDLWLSHWIPTSFNNLKKVHLSSCAHVPPFHKLPVLEELDIVRCNFHILSIMFLGLEDASSSGQLVGGFPRLKKLRFSYCVDWKEWNDIEKESTFPVMALLEELEINHCRSLHLLPLNLLGKATSLRVVRIFDKTGLYERYNNISGCDRDKIPLLPNQTWTVHQMDPSDEVH